MEENLRNANYDFMDCLIETLMTSNPSTFETTSINYGGYAGFTYTHLEKDGWQFKTEGEELIIEKDGNEAGRYPNNAFIFDWLVGMAMYIKERNLVEDFKKFYMF